MPVRGDGRDGSGQHFTIAKGPADDQFVEMRANATIIDLFCGVGGFTLGAAQAGFRPIMGVDIDSDLISGYRLNFPNSVALQADVSQMDKAAWDYVLKGARPVAVIGGPPCQGFSRIGKRSSRDSRNTLVQSFIRQVLILKPAFFVMENVEGLSDPTFRPLVLSAVAVAQRKYAVVGPLKINAADAGAPTQRKRLVLIGYDRDQLRPVQAEEFEFSGSPSTTVRDAIADLPAPQIHADGCFGWANYPDARNKLRCSGYAVEMRKPLPQGLGWTVAIDKLRAREVSGFQNTCHTKETIRRFSKVRPGGVDLPSRYPRLSWDGQCPTLRAGTGVERGSFQAARPIHPESDRVVTVREAARLQGFPDGFVFHRTKWHSFRMIGNSVSPPLAHKILKILKRKLI